MSSNPNKTESKPGTRPPAAVELTPEGVLAAAIPAPGQPPVYAYEQLFAGALIPGIGEPNLRAPEAIAAAIQSALDQVAPRSRSVTLVLPDTAVRVFVLDFDTLPAKPAEALPILRFRLRKMVPFEVEHAGISYQILYQDRDECKVLISILPGQVLAEYEAAVRSAGYEPGAVLPSSLAALEAIHSLNAVLMANLSGLSLTTSITNGQDLLLYRTLDLPEDLALRQSEVQRGIAVAVAYYEDKLGVRPERVEFAGNGGADSFAQWLELPEIAIADLVAHPEIGVATSLGHASIAGVAGALAGVK